ncbi:lysozyme inhibitor LprI family protein [Thalassotalea agariperforans]
MKIKYVTNGIFISTCALLLSLPIAAKKITTVDECDQLSPKNSDFSSCLDQVKTHAERELTTWINNQIFTLEELKKQTGRGAALTIFKRSQTAFEKYREDNCRWQYLQISPATGADSAYKSCYIKLTQARSKELSELSR